MKTFLFLILVLLATSCEEPSYHQRVKVLENGTVCLIILDKFENNYMIGDTVWVDVELGVIDNTCPTAMKCVLID